MSREASMRELVFAFLLVVSASLIVIGVALVSAAAAWVTAGVLLTVLSVVIFSDVA